MGICGPMWLGMDFTSLAKVLCCLSQVSVAVTSSHRGGSVDEIKHTPTKNADKVDEPCSSSADTCSSTDPSVDNGKLERLSTSDFSVTPSMSLEHIIPNGRSVIKSCDEVTRGNSTVCTERHIPQNVSRGQQFSLSSLTSCVQSLHSPVMCTSATVMSSPPSAATNPSSRPSAANMPPAALNWEKFWHIQKSPVSALDALRISQGAATEPLSDQNASRYSATGHFSHSENNRQRSVKAGSTWFPSEFQTSSDCSTPKTKTVERASSARPCTSGGGSSSLNSPLKKFVDRHPTRNIPAPNLSRSSEGGGFPWNGIAEPCASEPVGDQPIDLSIQRRKVAPKSQQNLQPDRTRFNTTASDEPLDLSRASSSVRPDRQVPRPPSHIVRPTNSGNKLPSGMIDLQNYCSRLLSGGYSLDSPLSAVTSSSHFSSLVSIL